MSPQSYAPAAEYHKDAAMLTLATRFFLELAGVVALGYAAFELAAGTPLGLVVAVSASLAFVTVWAVVAAPKARNPLSPAVRSVIGTLMLLGVAASLAWAGLPAIALVFAAAVVINQVMLVALDPVLPAGVAHAAEPRR